MKAVKKWVYLTVQDVSDISTNVHTSDKIAPVCLPLRGVEAEPLVGVDMVTAGWGKTGNGELALFSIIFCFYNLSLLSRDKKKSIL